MEVEGTERKQGVYIYVWVSCWLLHFTWQLRGFPHIAQMTVIKRLVTEYDFCMRMSRTKPLKTACEK